MLLRRFSLVTFNFLVYYTRLVVAGDLGLFASDWPDSKLVDDGVHSRNSTACNGGGYLASTAMTRGYKYSYNATRAVLYFVMAPDGALVQILLDDRPVGNKSTFNSVANVDSCDLMMFDTGIVPTFSTISIVHNGVDPASIVSNATMRLHKSIISEVDPPKTSQTSHTEVKPQPTMTPSASPQASQDQPAIPIEVIVGGTIGAFVGVAMLCGGIYFLYKRRRKEEPPAQVYQAVTPGTPNDDKFDHYTYKSTTHSIHPMSQQNAAGQTYSFVPPTIPAGRNSDASFGNFNPSQMYGHSAAPTTHSSQEQMGYSPYSLNSSPHSTLVGASDSWSSQNNGHR